MDKEELAAPKPGYVSWTTFITFLDSLKADGVPTHIDTSVLKNMSGTVKSQLRLTLLFLGLIDKDNQTQTALKRLAEAELEDRKSILREILMESYDFLFSPTDDFNIENSPASKFSEKFVIYTGDTRARAEAFFLSAAKFAGIKVSRYITQNRTTQKKKPVAKVKISTPPSNRPINAGAGERSPSDTPRTASNDPGQIDRYNLLRLLQEQQLPKDGVWTAAQKQQYMAAYDALLGLLVQTTDEEE